MSDSSGYRQGRPQPAYPPQGNGQPPRAAEPAAPDFMALAAMQLRQVITGIDARVAELARQAGGNGLADVSKATAEWTAEVREARLAVADRYIGLAQIQYDIPPDDEGDDEDDDDGDGYSRR